MKQLKFRAWNTSTSRMFDVAQITFVEGAWSVEVGQGVSIPNQPHIILMQFTGFSDVHGKDIYEGDVFLCPYGRDEHYDHRYVVKWAGEMGCFFLQKVGRPCPLGIMQPAMPDARRYRIIGNVYEVRELLY